MAGICWPKDKLHVVDSFRKTFCTRVRFPASPHIKRKALARVFFFLYAGIGSNQIYLIAAGIEDLEYIFEKLCFEKIRKVCSSCKERFWHLHYIDFTVTYVIIHDISDLSHLVFGLYL